jgi:GAF domain-containing protein
VTPDADGVLVLTEDVSEQIHAQRMGELFVSIANDMTSERDETSSIRASVAHASEALGADASSIFLLSPDGGRLHGALVGWDWTRTSFVAELHDWPNVQQAIAGNEAVYLTADTARLAEEVWFERRGIKAAICAPMAARGRVVGVLFFDYSAPASGHVDLALSKRVADQCAMLVEHATRLTGSGLSERPGAYP